VEGYPSKGWREEVGFLRRVYCFVTVVVGGERANRGGSAIRCQYALSIATENVEPACSAGDDWGSVHFLPGHGSQVFSCGPGCDEIDTLGRQIGLLPTFSDFHVPLSLHAPSPI